MNRIGVWGTALRVTTERRRGSPPGEKDLRQLYPVKLVMFVLAGLMAVACDNGDPPTAPSPAPTVTETFTGTVTRNGAQVHSFVATTQGIVTATISAVDPATSPAIGFSMGTWDSFNNICTAVLTNNNATTSAVLTGNVVGISSLCVRLFDPFSAVPDDAPVNYTVTVTRP
jgi:hypothetical protein